MTRAANYQVCSCPLDQGVGNGSEQQGEYTPLDIPVSAMTFLLSLTHTLGSCESSNLVSPLVQMAYVSFMTWVLFCLLSLKMAKQELIC